METPSHIAIIMDGNGRWAQNRGLARTDGHKEGVKTLKTIVKTAAKLNISCLTVYAFSTENWKRPGDEVNFLLELFAKTLKNEASELAQKDVVIKIIGRKKLLPDFVLKEIIKLEKKTENNNGLQLNIAFNYGGRA